jgi:hypothetical protein
VYKTWILIFDTDQTQICSVDGNIDRSLAQKLELSWKCLEVYAVNLRLVSIKCENLCWTIHVYVSKRVFFTF